MTQTKIDRSKLDDSLGCLAETVQTCIRDLAKGDDETYKNLVADFWHMFMQYASWARPKSWMLDFQDSDGSFGILLVGEYTCLVNVRANDGKPSVSGHS